MWAVTHYVVKIHVLVAVMYFYVAKLVKNLLKQ